MTRSSTPFLTADWDQGWRSTRIGERLAGLPTRSHRPTWPTIQLDTEDSFAKVLVPALLAVPLEASEADPDSDELLEFTREARELLRGWDFTTPAGDAESGAAAAYYNAVWRNLLELLFDDELPAGLKADGGAPLALGGRSSCSPTPRAPGGTTSSPPTSPRARTRSCARPSSRPGSS